jgi:2-keto-3-deoxy-6-phosphogluconate aldolase
MNRMFVRRGLAAVAAVAAVGAGTVATTPAAEAAATDCLNKIAGPAIDPQTHVVMSPLGTVFAGTYIYSGSVCSNVNVSIGISRTDTTGFRNQSAGRVKYEDNAYMFSNAFAMGPGDAGQWMVRQIAVKDSAGRLAVRTFPASSVTTKYTLQRASILTPARTGTLPAGQTALSGRLQAYTSTGGVAPLAAGQQVLIQVRPRGAAAYKTIATALTSTSGFYSRAVSLGGYRGADVRVAYLTPYQTIASDFAYVGRVA